jgi:hypothetical protein
LAQKLGQLQPLIAVFPPECTVGPTCIFWANLTPFSLTARRAHASPDAHGGQPHRGAVKQKSADHALPLRVFVGDALRCDASVPAGGDVSVAAVRGAIQAALKIALAPAQSVQYLDK